MDGQVKRADHRSDETAQPAALVASGVRLDPQTLGVVAQRELAEFRARVAGVPYERKGILYSEMFFLFLCARAVAPKRILESGRARGQSTLLLSLIFPHLPIVSIESDPHSLDVPTAAARLQDRGNVELRFGDATRILPAQARAGDIVLIDGPKGFRGLRLALRLLATGKVKLVFVHDCSWGSVERAFLEAHVPGTIYSDAIEFARVAHVLDADCWADMPPDRRFDDDRAPRAYGYGLACIAHDPSVSYRWLLARVVLAGFGHRYRKHRGI